LILRFPEWIRVKKYARAVFGSEGENPAYKTNDAGAELLISTTSPPKDDYSSRLALFGPLLDSQRAEVLCQHPKLLITALTAAVLLWILAILVVRVVRSAEKGGKTPEPQVTATL